MVSDAGQTGIPQDAKPVYASFWERLGALLLDTLILWVGLSLLGNLLGQKTDQTFLGVQFSWIGTQMNIIVTWLYFAIQEASVYQGTLGKRALHIKVTGSNGRRIAFGRATARYFGRLLSTLVLFAGYFLMLGNAQHQCLHDKIANTLVLK